jgi:hypothetical protein
MASPFAWRSKRRDRASEMTCLSRFQMRHRFRAKRLAAKHSAAARIFGKIRRIGVDPGGFSEHAPAMQLA